MLDTFATLRGAAETDADADADEDNENEPDNPRLSF